MSSSLFTDQLTAAKALAQALGGAWHAEADDDTDHEDEDDNHHPGGGGGGHHHHHHHHQNGHLGEPSEAENKDGRRGDVGRPPRRPLSLPSPKSSRDGSSATAAGDYPWSAAAAEEPQGGYGVEVEDTGGRIQVEVEGSGAIGGENGVRVGDKGANGNYNDVEVEDAEYTEGSEDEEHSPNPHELFEDRAALLRTLLEGLPPARRLALQTNVANARTPADLEAVFRDFGEHLCSMPLPTEAGRSMSMDLEQVRKDTAREVVLVDGKELSFACGSPADEPTLWHDELWRSLDRRVVATMLAPIAAAAGSKSGGSGHGRSGSGGGGISSSGGNAPAPAVPAAATAPAASVSLAGRTSRSGSGVGSGSHTSLLPSFAFSLSSKTPEAALPTLARGTSAGAAPALPPLSPLPEPGDGSEGPGTQDDSAIDSPAAAGAAACSDECFENAGARPYVAASAAEAAADAAAPVALADAAAPAVSAVTAASPLPLPAEPEARDEKVAGASADSADEMRLAELRQKAAAAAVTAGILQAMSRTGAGGDAYFALVSLFCTENKLVTPARCNESPIRVTFTAGAASNNATIGGGGTLSGSLGGIAGGGGGGGGGSAPGSNSGTPTGGGASGGSGAGSGGGGGGGGGSSGGSAGSSVRRTALAAWNNRGKRKLSGPGRVVVTVPSTFDIYLHDAREAAAAGGEMHATHLVRIKAVVREEIWIADDATGSLLSAAPPSAAALAEAAAAALAEQFGEDVPGAAAAAAAAPAAAAAAVAVPAAALPAMPQSTNAVAASPGTNEGEGVMAAAVGGEPLAETASEGLATGVSSAADGAAGEGGLCVAEADAAESMTEFGRLDSETHVDKTGLAGGTEASADDGGRGGLILDWKNGAGNPGSDASDGGSNGGTTKGKGTVSAPTSGNGSSSGIGRFEAFFSSAFGGDAAATAPGTTAASAAVASHAATAADVAPAAAASILTAPAAAAAPVQQQPAPALPRTLPLGTSSSGFYSSAAMALAAVASQSSQGSSTGGVVAAPEDGAVPVGPLGLAWSRRTLQVTLVERSMMENVAAALSVRLTLKRPSSLRRKRLVTA